MIRKFFAVIMVITIWGCSNLGSIRVTNGNKIENIEDPQDFGSIAYVDYFDYETLIEEKKQQASLAFEEPDRSDIPENGLIIAYVKTPEIESANTKWWQVVIKDNHGEVVKRVHGDDSVANYETTNGITVWKNSILVEMPRISPPFDVYIISDVHKKRWGYRVLGK